MKMRASVGSSEQVRERLLLVVFLNVGIVVANPFLRFVPTALAEGLLFFTCICYFIPDAVEWGISRKNNKRETKK